MSLCPFQEATRTLLPLTLSVLTMPGFDGTALTSPLSGMDCHHRIPAGEKPSSLGPEQDAGGQRVPSQRKRLPEDKGHFASAKEEEKRCQVMMHYKRFPDLI